MPSSFWLSRLFLIQRFLMVWSLKRIKFIFYNTCVYLLMRDDGDDLDIMFLKRVLHHICLKMTNYSYDKTIFHEITTIFSSIEILWIITSNEKWYSAQNSIYSKKAFMHFIFVKFCKHSRLHVDTNIETGASLQWYES